MSEKKEIHAETQELYELIRAKVFEWLDKQPFQESNMGNLSTALSACCATFAELLAITTQEKAFSREILEISLRKIEKYYDKLIETTENNE